MARRRTRNDPEPELLTLAVEATAVIVGRMAAARVSGNLGEIAATKIRIEGQSGGPSCGVPRDTLLLVSSDDDLRKVPGFAIGGKTPWTVSCEIPRYQFADLMGIILAGKLVTVDMLFDHLRWHKGTLLSIRFCTRPLPSESDS